jgi:hypothetical protein
MAEDYIWIITDETTAPEPIEGQRGWGEEVRKGLPNGV